MNGTYPARALCAPEVIKALVELTRDACLVMTPDAIIIAANHESSRLYGYPIETLVGMHVSSLSPLQSQEMLAEEIANARGEGMLFSSVHTRADGHNFPVEVAWKLGKACSQDVLVAHVRDITTRVMAEQEAQRLAYHDPLTGLANRTKMMADLGRAIADAERHGDLLAVAYLDLDDFKPVNDDLGHAAGDRLLVELAARLTRELRSTDTIARMGGDEFAITLPRLSGPGALERTAQKLARIVAEPTRIEGVLVSVTASIGVAAFESGDDSDALLAKADGAMYGAKRAGVVWGVQGG